MDSDLKVEFKSGQDLTQREIDAVNEAKFREWKIPPMETDQRANSTFVLLKDDKDNILAQGELITVNGVVFNNQSFDILGIGGVIANIKRQGHGRRLLLTIKDYLLEHKKTGVGLTGVPEFYRKCGYSTDRESLKRFVHVVDSKEIRNTEDEYVAFIDSDDRFMQKVLSSPSKKVYLPRAPNW